MCIRAAAAKARPHKFALHVTAAQHLKCSKPEWSASWWSSCPEHGILMHYVSADACKSAQVLKPARKPRKKMVSFAGGFLFWQDPGGLRSEMRTMFQVCSEPPAKF